MPKKRIVIVDDDSIYLQELHEILLSNNYAVSAFSSGTTALEMIPKIEPDLVLLDLKMEKISGIKLAGELTHYKKELPILAMTAFYTDKEHMVMMGMSGIKTVLIKPVPITVLLEKIKLTIKKEKGNQFANCDSINDSQKSNY